MEERRIIGFDRKIALSWLDATADWAAQGLSAAEIRQRLDRLLAGQVAGAGAWLLEAGITASTGASHPLHNLAGQAAFYPFDLRVSPGDLRRRSRLALHQPPDGAVVTRH